jgi:hypothetical protein
MSKLLTPFVKSFVAGDVRQQKTHRFFMMMDVDFPGFVG